MRIDAWNKLLQARAIENLSYVAGVNCMGTDNNGFEYDGSSHILDFKGNGIAYVDSDKGFLYASLSKEKLDKFRSKFPTTTTPTYLKSSISKNKETPPDFR